MLFDTDVLIWAQRGDPKAIDLVSDAAERAVSVLTYMELLQGARNHAEARTIKNFLIEGVFQVLPLTENIGHRALIYIEEYVLSSGIRSGDAIIAATAVENGFLLVSGNRKHYKPLRELQFRIFRPK